MSRENVDLVKRLYDAFNHRDQTIPAALVDPDVEWDTSAIDVPGLTGVYIDAGESVVAVTGLRARGRESGIEINQESVGLVADVRDGRVVRFAAFATKEQALAAVGLSE